MVCEKPLATDPGDGGRARGRWPTGRAPSPRCRSSTASTRWSARRGPGSPTVRSPCAWSTASYLQDWLSTDQDDNWRVDAELSGPSRAFADIGSHWCDLVEFVTGDRLASVCAELVTAVPEREHADAHVPAFAAAGGRERRTSAGGRHRGRGPGAVPHRRRGERLGGGEPDLRRPQEPAAARGRDRRRHPGLRPGAPRHALGRAARARRRSSSATRTSSTRPRRRTPPSRPATRRATRTASTPSSPTPCGPSTPATAPRSTGCRPSPTAPGRSRSPTPCSGRPATAAGWTSRGHTVDARRSHREAGVPHRLPPEAEPGGHLRLGGGGGVRGARGGGLARPRRPTVRRHPPERRRLRREGGRRDQGAVRPPRPRRSRRSPTTTTTSTPTRPSGPPTTSTCTAASTPPPASAAPPSARSSDGTRAAPSPTTSATRRRCSPRSSTTPARRA